MTVNDGSVLRGNETGRSDDSGGMHMECGVGSHVGGRLEPNEQYRQRFESN